jgi:hypothetical protein
LRRNRSGAVWMLTANLARGIQDRYRIRILLITVTFVVWVQTEIAQAAMSEVTEWLRCSG